MKKRRSSRIESLERRCAALARQVNQLSACQEVAVSQLLLLDTLCSSFSKLQAHRASQIEVGIHVDLKHNDKIEDHSQHSSAAGPVQLQDSSSTVLQEDTETRRIAPRSKQLDLFDHVTSQDQDDVQDLTSKQLATRIRDAVLISSLQLHFASSGTVGRR